MHSINPECPNSLNRKNHFFKELHAAINNLGRHSRIDAISAEVKHTSMITVDEEEALWVNGVLRAHNPRVLLAAVFFFLEMARMFAWEKGMNAED